MKGQFIAKLRSAKKTPKVTSVSEKIHILQGNGFVWKDLQNPDRSKLEELQKEHGLNALNVEDCLSFPSLIRTMITYFSYCIFPRLDQKRSTNTANFPYLPVTDISLLYIKAIWIL